MSKIEEHNISNFQFIWEEWLVPLIDDLYDQTDENFRKFCHLEKRNLEQIEKAAEKYYQKKRQEVKKAFYGDYKKGDSINEHRMDFHKIGAILCRTFIEYKVFNFDTMKCKDYIDANISSYDTDWVVKNALINFRFAFYSSIVFLYQAMIFEYSTEYPEIYDDLCDAEKLHLYHPKEIVDAQNNKKQVNESFENCVVLDLAKRNINNKSFDYFMYSIILYQLEEYNRGLLSKKGQE